ncbi:MAG: threonine synthase [Candidatus Bathyarchaeia archaeon]
MGVVVFERNRYIKALNCRECGKEHPPIKIHSCKECFGPLEVVYNLNSININKHTIERREKSLWRYRELLPIEDKTKIVDLGAGFTPLQKCKRLAEVLKVKRIFIKNDTVNPTGSFKDRPATVAASKSLEFKFKAIGCASTGNLAAAAAAHAARARLPCYVFIPSNIENSKVLQAATYGAKIIVVKGTYDDANMLAAQASYEYNWAIVNVNLRPYYVEGSKTIVFEICEQLGWRAPENIIVPMGSGALLCAIWRGLKQLRDLGLIDELETKLIGAQPEGCSPIVKAFKTNSEDIFPIEKPETIAKSLAIGDPSDGIYALRAIKESKGLAEYATDKEIIEGTNSLAKTEGIFAEPAGGITIAVLKKLIEAGIIAREEEVVCCVTGSGFKSLETFSINAINVVEVEPNLNNLENLVGSGVL